MDKRYISRIKTLIRVEVSIDGLLTSKSKGYITDISETGAKLETLAKLNTGDNIVVKSNQPNEESIKAKVIWIKKVLADFFVCGIRFEKILTDTEVVNKVVSAHIYQKSATRKLGGVISQ